MSAICVCEPQLRRWNQSTGRCEACLYAVELTDESPAEHNAQGPFLSAGMIHCVECPSCQFRFDASDCDDDPHDVNFRTNTCAACGYSAHTEIE